MKSMVLLWMLVCLLLQTFVFGYKPLEGVGPNQLVRPIPPLKEDFVDIDRVNNRTAVPAGPMPSY